MSGNVPAPNERDPFRIVAAIRQLFEGRSNAMGRFTCELNQSSTTVSNPNVGLESEIQFTARHANAAAEIGDGTFYLSAVSRGSFTVAHANSATANRTFGYAICG